MSENDWHRTLPSEDLAVGDITRVEVGDGAVLVGRLSDGRPVAFATNCPHQDTPLSEGAIWDDLVRCRQHQYLYDPRTGENVLPARSARPQTLWKLKPGYLPTYAVEERDGWVWVCERANPPPEAYDPTLEEPQAVTPPPAPQREAEPAQEGAPGPPAAKTVRVRVGARFELRLPTNPRLPGFIWQTEVESGLVEVVETGLTQAVAGSPEPPRWRVRLVALAPGRDLVRCSFQQPWARDREPSEVRHYKVLIVP
jgi:toluene monooxygenase system ferredoxin subunit